MAESKEQNPEDEEHTLVFIDMLGFAALTKAFRTRVAHDHDKETGFTSSSITPIQGQIITFHNVVDRCVFESGFYSDVTAMLFSDCAFLDAGNSFATALLAREIMRKCIKEQVPVRMGLGRGTFYPLEFSTKISGSTQVSRCRFVGTSVVFANAAEQCGGKGMRIFLHPSVVPDLQNGSRRLKVIPLPKPFAEAGGELDYLYEPTPMSAALSADAQDREIFKAVKAMKNPQDPLPIRRQYTQTLMALNRMRKANSRKRVSIR